MATNQHSIKRSRDVLRPAPVTSFFSLVVSGSIVGAITGLIVSIFRWIIDHAMKALMVIYPQMAQHPLYLIPYIILTVVIIWLLNKIMQAEPIDLVGSGVPQIQEILRGQHRMNAKDVLWRRFVGGLLAICPGLFLGREGPCIQMGACVGQILGEGFHLSTKQKRFLMESGIAAGLSAAFSAPLAGVIFLVEEITFKFRPRKCMAALAAAISADLVTVAFFGVHPCLYLPLQADLPASAYSWLILVGVIIGVLAFCYQYTLLNLHWWFSKLPLPQKYHKAIPLLLVIPIGLWNARVLGGSHGFILYLTKLPATVPLSNLLVIFLIFLALRFVFSMISYGSTVPGGIFMPLLVLGALIGGIIGIVMINHHLIPATCFLNLIVITMAAYFGAVEGTPFTALTLLTEMVGSIEQILPMVLLTFIAYLTCNVLGGRPIHAALREEMTFEGA
nr:ClC family H(+)/Cl(-) exchange transporter [Limosilactobacillus kribbianus]